MQGLGELAQGEFSKKHSASSDELVFLNICRDRTDPGVVVIRKGGGGTRDGSKIENGRFGPIGGPSAHGPSQSFPRGVEKKTAEKKKKGGEEKKRKR